PSTIRFGLRRVTARSLRALVGAATAPSSKTSTRTRSGKSSIASAVIGPSVTCIDRATRQDASEGSMAEEKNAGDTQAGGATGTGEPARRRVLVLSLV